MLRFTDIIAAFCISVIWFVHRISIPEKLTWLRSLDLPPFSPPYWLFTPIWIAIYIGVIIVLAYAFRVLSRKDITTIIIWHINAIAHIAWVPLFFRLHMKWAAACDASIIAVTACILVWHMARYAWWVGVLIAPYAIWTVFATYIAFGIAILN